MKKTLLLVVLGMVWSGVVPAGAVIIDSGTSIPVECILSNYNGTGLDWVYAGPIAPNEWGLGNIEVPSYRASEGWRFATAEEWAQKPLWTDFIKPGYTPDDFDTWTTDHTMYTFASEYWGEFRHVDLNDAASGLITNGFDIGSLHNVWETWYVRDAAGAPDGPAVAPAPGAILLGALGAGLVGWMRRRNTL